MRGLELSSGLVQERQSWKLTGTISSEDDVECSGVALDHGHVDHGHLDCVVHDCTVRTPHQFFQVMLFFLHFHCCRWSLLCRRVALAPPLSHLRTLVSGA